MTIKTTTRTAHAKREQLSAPKTRICFILARVSAYENPESEVKSDAG